MPNGVDALGANIAAPKHAIEGSLIHPDNNNFIFACQPLTVRVLCLAQAWAPLLSAIIVRASSVHWVMIKMFCEETSVSAQPAVMANYVCGVANN